jgi:SAM-dependent methyltransferase
MDSREAGLVLAQQLLGIDDLHYGWWDDDLDLTISNLTTAQQRYSDQLITRLPAASPEVRILDIGSGTGHLIQQCLDKGYRVDGVSPSPSLSKQIRQRIEQRKDCDTQLFECRFEDFPVDENLQKYDAAYFSESFQYISMTKAFQILEKILKPGGKVIICDFFKRSDADLSAPGAHTFGGGHDYNEFLSMLEEIPFDVESNIDITEKVSRNIALLNDLLMNRLGPALHTLGTFLGGRYPKTYWLLTRPFRKRFAKLETKYFSGHRSQETFERFKTYHLVQLTFTG